MPKRYIYDADEYLKGLEAQGIVVHDAMRNTVKRLNPGGIIEGHAPIDDQANPLLPDDPRYEAGHADKVREAQERIEAFRISEAEEARRNTPGLMALEASRQAKADHERQADGIDLSPGKPNNPSSFNPSMMRVDITRSELAALIQHLAASGHSAQRVAELAALLV